MIQAAPVIQSFTDRGHTEGKVNSYVGEFTVKEVALLE